MPLTTQQKETYKIFSQHGSGDAMVEITATDVVLLIHIAYLDVHDGESAEWFIKEFEELRRIPRCSKSFKINTLKKVAGALSAIVLGHF